MHGSSTQELFPVILGFKITTKVVYEEMKMPEQFFDLNIQMLHCHYLVIFSKSSLLHFSFNDLFNLSFPNT